MMTIRFVGDARLELHTADGRVVVLSHRAGEVIEADECIARLFLNGHAAVRVPDMEHAVAPKGEQR